MTPDTAALAAAVLVTLGAAGTAATFVLHPLWIRLAALLSRAEPVRTGDDAPEVCAVIAFRGGGTLLEDKIANLLALDYPENRLRAIFVSDGPLPDDVALPAEASARGWVLSETAEPVGKNLALNHGIESATADILLFTDLDARLEPGALRRLVAFFADARVGGVCGQRVVGERHSAMDEGQAGYVAWDSWVKVRESGLGFLTSGDGKLYAMRRDLFKPLPGTVTDDSFNCLTVIGAGKRMVFAPEARAHIPKPARSAAHELPRRRRITARSLHGLYLNRRLLNPLRYPTFATALLLNKVFRRLLPLFLALVAAGSVIGAPAHPAFAALVAVEAAGLALAALHPVMEGGWGPKPLRRITGLTFYFLIGNLGMALGVIDFLMGRRVSQWTPKKTD